MDGLRATPATHHLEYLVTREVQLGCLKIRLGRLGLHRACIAPAR
jgi:hypothetical protein